MVLRLFLISVSKLLRKEFVKQNIKINTIPLYIKKYCYFFEISLNYFEINQGKFDKYPAVSYPLLNLKCAAYYLCAIDETHPSLHLDPRVGRLCASRLAILVVS